MEKSVELVNVEKRSDSFAYSNEAFTEHIQTKTEHEENFSTQTDQKPQEHKKVSIDEKTHIIISVSSDKTNDGYEEDETKKPFAGMNEDILFLHSQTLFWRSMRRVIVFLIFAAFLALLSAIIALIVIHPRCRKAEKKDWWQTAVVYRVKVGEFVDSDDDGHGDIKGITNNLDTFEKLGVSALSLSPFYRHDPVSDIEILNHTEVDQTYGSLDDVEMLIEKAHQKDIKVILDFIPNHTSKKHGWFSSGGNTKNFFVKRDSSTRPNNWVSKENVSAWYPDAAHMYLAQLGGNKPDLDMRNPLVQEQLEAILDFWLELGADGFYIRHSEFLFEDYLLRDEPVIDPSSPDTGYSSLKHIYTSGLPENNHAFARWHTVVTKEKYNNTNIKVLIADISGGATRSRFYYERNGGDGVDVPINRLLDTMTTSTCNLGKMLKKNYLKAWRNATPEDFTYSWTIGESPPCQTALPEEAQTSLILLNLLLPGFVYTDNFAKLYTSKITNATGSSLHLNSSLNTQNPLFQVFMNASALRNEPSIKYGRLHTLTTKNDNVIAYVREFDGVNSFMIVINFGWKNITENLTDKPHVAASGTVVLTTTNSGTYQRDGTIKNNAINLRPYQGIVATWPYAIKQY